MDEKTEKPKPADSPDALVADVDDHVFQPPPGRWFMPCVICFRSEAAHKYPSTNRQA